MTTIIGTNGDDNLKGTKFDDTMYGGNGEDFLQGKAGNDYLDGGSGDDMIHGDAGDDTLVGGQGDDFLHGGTGTDTAVYSGSVLDYSFGSDGENFFVSHTGGSQIDGNDRLLHVERLQFNDILIDLTQNNAPLAFDDVASTDEDVGTYSSGSASVLDNDFDWEGDTLTATPGTFNGTYGTLVLNADGTYSYTPYASNQSLDDGETVQDSFTYIVSDGSLSDTGTLTITIAGLNDAPVANDDTASTTEDASVSGNVLANDTDIDGETLTVANAGAYVGTYGTLTLAADGSYTYAPNAAAQALDDGEVAQDVFTYTASDGTASDTATLTVTVNGLNDAPVANDDTTSTTEDAAVSGNVLANDTDVDGEALTVANPGTYVGTYGTLVLAADGSYTYTPNAAAQPLDDGEAVNDVFSYTASDGTASDSATLTVTVTGLNDAPVANDDTASTTEDASVSGNVLTNDTDVDGETLTVANAGAYVGTYGTLTLAADGSYTYAPNAAAQALDTGEVAQDVFTYTASDGTASDTATLTVNVAGLNDAPVANDDTATTTEDDAVSGNVLANDTDVDGETLTVTNPGTYIGAYGTLVLAANGSYTYTPGGAAQPLDEGEVVNDVFSYVASDGTASDTATLTITVTGLGGVPDANDDTATTTEDASVSGNVLTNDTDDELDPLTVSNPGTYVGTYGTLTLAANGSYTYTPNAFADGLAVGESAQDVFSYTATDGTGSDTATLTVTVNGTNDAPTIDAGGTDASGSVTELPDGDPGENIAVHTDSGAVAFDDVDVSDTHTAGFAPQGGGYLGTFTLDPVDQMGDSVGWDFTVSDAALEGLSEGEVRTQTYTIGIDDGNGGTATQNVTITITGAGVGVGPQTVWYIDNSAVGSANTGTQADPYTSIAAFNAAQGTLGGPQAGHNVYLLAGTGTGIYAEADGINLLDGQILTGVATGPVRPTIEATAGDGVNAAQNNNVSGLDIGNTSGADIADSGASVGTLTISDVGSSGTGQIIDIDQGGTLNVTLNDATSLSSSGGAIDLAGVGGSFTVTGATTITGVHSGGGIDITGSSVAATFGGGNVATLTTTAVNFVGNTGSLTIGGGFDIVTTTGAGLNATGGGTVTVTGSGNSIVSVGGTALSVVGTGIGAGGLNFDSISANGGTNGIVLSNTGSSGGLNVVGDGGGTNNGSGGTIQNMTGDGILLTNTENVRLAYMNVQDNGGDGIGGSGVNGFVLDRLNISDNGTSALLDHAGINIAGLTGTSSAGARPTSISNSVISNNFEFEVVISNSAGTLTNLRVIDSTMSSNGATGLHGDLFSFLSSGTASMGLTVSGSTFDGNTVAGQLTGTAVNVNAGGGTVNADIGTSNFIDNSVAVIMSAAGNGNLTFDVHDNGQMTGNRSVGINVFSVSGATGTINGTIENNVVGTQGVPGSGSMLGRGIQALIEGGGTTNLLITGNTVQSMGSSFEGIAVIESVTVGIVNATITNNIIRDIPAARGLLVQTTNAGTLNASISGNQFSNIGAAQDLRIAESLAGTLNITQLAATAAANPNEVDDANGIANTRVSVAGTPQYGQPAPTLPSSPSLPLLAASEGPGGAGDDLSQSELDLIVNAAIDRWAAAGATDGQLATMRAVAFDIANMTGLTLGSSSDGHVIIDSDAAGFSWFVDATPGDDSEYSGSGMLLIAAADTEAGNRMDLLTTVMHELGHQIGLGDDHDSDHRGELMFATIDPGERRLPDGMFVTETAAIAPGRAEWGDMPLSHPDLPMM